MNIIITQTIITIRSNITRAHTMNNLMIDGGRGMLIQLYFMLTNICKIQIHIFHWKFLLTNPLRQWWQRGMLNIQVKSLRIVVITINIINLQISSTSTIVIRHALREKLRDYSEIFPNRGEAGSSQFSKLQSYLKRALKLH